MRTCSRAVVSTDQLGLVKGRVAREVIDHIEPCPTRLLVVPGGRGREDRSVPLDIGEVDLFVLATRVWRIEEIKEALLEVSAVSWTRQSLMVSRRGRLDGEAVGYG